MGPTSPDKASIRAAMSAAAAADVVVLVVGDSSAGDARVPPGAALSSTGGENMDRHSLALPGGQQALLSAALEEPTVLAKLIVVHIGSRSVRRSA